MIGRAVDQRIGTTAGGEAIGPEAFNPTEAPECWIDIGEGRCNGGWMGRILDGAVLATQNEYRALRSAEDVIWTVEAGIGGTAGDVAGVEEGIDVIEGPVARKDVLKDGGGRRGG